MAVLHDGAAPTQVFPHISSDQGMEMAWRLIDVNVILIPLKAVCVIMFQSLFECVIRVLATIPLGGPHDKVFNVSMKCPMILCCIYIVSMLMSSCTV